MTIGINVAPKTLDLTTNADAAIPEVLLYNVYQGLVKLDGAGKIVPSLAESWKVNATGKVYTFVLRKGVRFQNGDALTSNDVVYSFERVLTSVAKGKPHPHADEMAPVRTVKAIDRTTVRVTLKQRSNDWLYAMTGPAGVILDQKAVATIATRPVGTAPTRSRRTCRATASRSSRTRRTGARRPASTRSSSVPTTTRARSSTPSWRATSTSSTTCSHPS